MRPLECHWKLPEGCFCCYCRPFSVGELDWPVIEVVALFREIPDGLENWTFQLKSIAIMELLSFSFGTALVPLLLSKVQRVVLADSSLALQVQMCDFLQLLMRFV